MDYKEGHDGHQDGYCKDKHQARNALDFLFLMGQFSLEGSVSKAGVHLCNLGAVCCRNLILEFHYQQPFNLKALLLVVIFFRYVGNVLDFPCVGYGKVTDGVGVEMAVNYGVKGAEHQGSSDTDGGDLRVTEAVIPVVVEVAAAFFVGCYLCKVVNAA